MATAGVPLWSTTAANNATADPAVNWAEGMAPSAVNDSARAMMASVAKWRDDLSGIVTGGSSTAYTVTTGATFASASDMSGMIFSIIPHVTSGGSPTLAVDGLTARAINDSTGVAVSTGALIAGAPYLVKYVNASTEFILLGRSSVFTTLKATSNIIAAPGTTAGRPSAVQGGFRFNTDTGLPEFSDGTNWFSLITTLSGAQMPYGAVINGTIAESHSGNAVTFSLKTLAGADPSTSDPVLLAFRNAAVGAGGYVYRTVTAALNFTLSSGSKLGAVDGVPFKVWLVLFDDGGTIKLGAINCVSGINIYALGQIPVADSIADDNLGGSDLAQKFYTKNGLGNVSAKAYVIVGYAAYESGLATAGLWASSPTRIQLYGASVPLPGQVLQSRFLTTTTNVTNASTSNWVNSISDSISTTSAANLVQMRTGGSTSNSVSGGAGAEIAFFRGSTQIGSILRGVHASAGNTGTLPMTLEHRDAPGTVAPTTYSAAVRSFSSGTAGYPSVNGGYFALEEIMV